VSEIDEFSRYEVLHVPLFLAESVESQLLDHLFIQENRDCVEFAGKVNKALFALYLPIWTKLLD
jgi:hypothetical protein